MMALGQSGCAFLGGAAVGGLATGAGYEINAHSQMSKLEADYKAERISRSEYDSRKAQIKRAPSYIKEDIVDALRRLE